MRTRKKTHSSFDLPLLNLDVMRLFDPHTAIQWRMHFKWWPLEHMSKHVDTRIDAFDFFSPVENFSYNECIHCSVVRGLDTSMIHDSCHSRTKCDTQKLSSLLRLRAFTHFIYNNSDDYHIYEYGMAWHMICVTLVRSNDMTV